MQSDRPNQTGRYQEEEDAVSGVFNFRQTKGVEDNHSSSRHQSHCFESWWIAIY
jgi:hypothetical protein